jgi:hypothetical protein
MEARQMTPEERAEVQVVGTVTASWNSINFLHITPSEKTLENKAISELRAAAQKQGYKGNIDIKNISIAGSFSGWNVLGFMCLLSPPVLFNVQKVTASGDVVEYTATGGTSSAVQKKLADAIVNASAMMSDRLPRDSTIAILSVYSSDRNTSEFIIGELEYNFVNTGKFKIVDRRRLDQIRTEQNFQLSGDVDDRSAVSIGNMLGANIVITGEITGTGSNQRLVLKALDVKTAQIITMAREQL